MEIAQFDLRLYKDYAPQVVVVDAPVQEHHIAYNHSDLGELQVAQHQPHSALTGAHISATAVATSSSWLAHHVTEGVCNVQIGARQIDSLKLQTAVLKSVWTAHGISQYL